MARAIAYCLWLCLLVGCFAPTSQRNSEIKSSPASNNVRRARGASEGDLQPIRLPLRFQKGEEKGELAPHLVAFGKKPEIKVVDLNESPFGKPIPGLKLPTPNDSPFSGFQNPRNSSAQAIGDAEAIKKAYKRLTFPGMARMGNERQIEAFVSLLFKLGKNRTPFSDRIREALPLVNAEELKAVLMLWIYLRQNYEIDEELAIVQMEYFLGIVTQPNRDNEIKELALHDILYNILRTFQIYQDVENAIDQTASRELADSFLVDRTSPRLRYVSGEIVDPTQDVLILGIQQMPLLDKRLNDLYGPFTQKLLKVDSSTRVRLFSTMNTQVLLSYLMYLRLNKADSQLQKDVVVAIAPLAKEEALLRLKSALGEGLIIDDKKRVRLNPDAIVDKRPTGKSDQFPFYPKVDLRPHAEDLKTVQFAGAQQLGKKPVIVGSWVFFPNGLVIHGKDYPAFLKRSLKFVAALKGVGIDVKKGRALSLDPNPMPGEYSVSYRPSFWGADGRHTFTRKDLPILVQYLDVVHEDQGLEKTLFDVNRKVSIVGPIVLLPTTNPNEVVAEKLSVWMLKVKKVITDINDQADKIEKEWQKLTDEGLIGGLQRTFLRLNPDGIDEGVFTQVPMVGPTTGVFGNLDEGINQLQENYTRGLLLDLKRLEMLGAPEELLVKIRKFIFSIALNLQEDSQLGWSDVVHVLMVASFAVPGVQWVALGLAGVGVGLEGILQLAGLADGTRDSLSFKGFLYSAFTFAAYGSLANVGLIGAGIVAFEVIRSLPHQFTRIQTALEQGHYATAAAELLIVGAFSYRLFSRSNLNALRRSAGNTLSTVSAIGRMRFFRALKAAGNARGLCLCFGRQAEIFLEVLGKPKHPQGTTSPSARPSSQPGSPSAAPTPRLKPEPTFKLIPVKPTNDRPGEELVPTNRPGVPPGFKPPKRLYTEVDPDNLPEDFEGIVGPTFVYRGRGGGSRLTESEFKKRLEAFLKALKKVTRHGNFWWWWERYFRDFFRVPLTPSQYRQALDAFKKLLEEQGKDPKKLAELIDASLFKDFLRVPREPSQFAAAMAELKGELLKSALFKHINDPVMVAKIFQALHAAAALDPVEEAMQDFFELFFRQNFRDNDYLRQLPRVETEEVERPNPDRELLEDADTAVLEGSQSGARGSGAGARTLPSRGLSPATIKALEEAGYEILEQIGQGGTAVVVLCKKEGKYYAVKEVLDDVLSEGNLNFLANEIVMLSQISGDFVLPWEALKVGDDGFILVMEFVGKVDSEGQPFSATLMQMLSIDYVARFTEDTATQNEIRWKIIYALADAVKNLNEQQGIVHHDIKSENIMLSIVEKDGEFQVSIYFIDWGGAAFVGGYQMNLRGLIVGTLEFLRHERKSESDLRSSPKDDIVALSRTIALMMLHCGDPEFGELFKALFQFTELDSHRELETYLKLLREIYEGRRDGIDQSQNIEMLLLMWLSKILSNEYNRDSNYRRGVNAFNGLGAKLLYKYREAILGVLDETQLRNLLKILAAVQHRRNLPELERQSAKDLEEEVLKLIGEQDESSEQEGASTETDPRQEEGTRVIND